jgi:hypothetical protein
MNRTPVIAATQTEVTRSRLHSTIIGALFAVAEYSPKLLHIRRNAQSWMLFRIFLGFGGAALVILPLSLWNSWLAAIAGLGLFLAAILLPPAQVQTASGEKARELGALVVVNGGKYERANAAPVRVQLFVGPERLWVLDLHLRPLLKIPVAEISSTDTTHLMDRWILEVRWSDKVAEFSYQGFFAEHLARAAQNSIARVIPASRPVVRRSRAASA